MHSYHELLDPNWRANAGPMVRLLPGQMQCLCGSRNPTQGSGNSMLHVPSHGIIFCSCVELTTVNFTAPFVGALRLL